MSEVEPLPSKSVRHVANTLNALGIKFAFVGGVAVALVSTPRYTADVDAVILDADNRLEWLIEELDKAGFSTRATNQISLTRRTRVLTLRDSNDIGVDLMLGLLPFDEDLVERAIIAQLDNDTDVPVASPEHLIVMKAIAWRDKDRLDIREIVTVNPSLDRAFVLTTFAEYADLLEVPERVGELTALLA